MHAFQVYTRNKRIKRVLQRKAQAVYERNLLLRIVNTWSARTVRVGDISAQYVRLKGHNIGEWMRAMRAPLRSVPALAFSDVDANAREFRIRKFAKVLKNSDLAVDHDNRLYRRVANDRRLVYHAQR